MRYPLFFLCLFSTHIFAWNAVGHRIIAQIAYDQLTPQAKKQVDQLTKVMFHSHYPSARFLRAATWPDRIRSQTKQYNDWHFIDIPDAKGGVTPPPLNSDNVVWAIAQAEKIVSDSSDTEVRRAKYLSFLIHFVGDIHQPMHCVTLYDAHFLQGDRGGNDFPIQSVVSHNLHAYWDDGLGLLVSPGSHYQFHYDQVEKIAKDWTLQYPREFFDKPLQEKAPMQWAQESHYLAVTDAYTLTLNAVPSQVYIQQGQVIVREQIVLAGDRLADILNKIF